MKRYINAVVLIISMLFLTGCSAFSIYCKEGADIEKKKGVPFYQKVGKYKKTTVITRTWVEIQFILDTLKEDSTTVEKSEKRSVYVHPDSLPLLAISEGIKMFQSTDSTQISDIDTAINRFFESSYTQGINRLSSTQIYQATDIRTETTNFLKESLISKSIDMITEVDYTKTFYFNSTIPFFGTANGTIKLAADGTITEGTASADNTKLADLLPLKEYAEKVLGIPSSADKSVQKPPKRITISANNMGYSYTLTKTFDLSYRKKPEFETPLAFAEATGIIREVIGAGGKKAEDDDSINITGKINLPKKLLD